MISDFILYHLICWVLGKNKHFLILLFPKKFRRTLSITPFWPLSIQSIFYHFTHQAFSSLLLSLKRLPSLTLSRTISQRCQHYRFRASTQSFLMPSLFPAFHLKCPASFAYFELGKMRSAQRQVELRRLGNQLTVLNKANSLCKIVFFPVFLKQRLSPGRIAPGIKISRVIVARARSV